MPQYVSYIMCCLIFREEGDSNKQTKKGQKTWEFRFACRKEFDFAVDTSKAMQWNQPAATANSS